jgi:multidrug efflux system membrane fusion protein
VNDKFVNHAVNNVLNLQEPTPTVLRESTPWAFVRKRRGLIILAGLAIVVLAALGLRMLMIHRDPMQGRPGGPAGAARFANNRDDNRDDPVAITMATVSSGDIQIRIPALGTVTPLATVTVKSQVSGQLQKIAFIEGQLVHQGDFLAQIDPRSYQAAFNQADGNLKRDQALLADAHLDLKRYEDLLKQDGISAQQVDTQRATVAQYTGTVEADEAALAAARVNLQYTHIISPVTGRVGLRQVDQGNYVTPADVNGIVVITQLQPITAIFPVPEDNVSQISRRLTAGAVMPVIAYDKSNSAKLADGKLLTLDNQIDTTTGTVKLRALFDNTDGSLFPNQFLNVQLIVDTLHDQVVIPNAAVHRGAPKGVVQNFVYVVDTKTSTVAVRPVQTGVVDGESVAIPSGLKVGDVIVTEGGDRLRDGAQVLLPGAPPPPPQQSGQGWNRRGPWQRSGGR